MSLSLKIKTTNGRIIETAADPDLTIFDLKAICCEELETEPEHQTLLFKGKVCADDTTLEELKIRDNDTLIVLLKRKRRRPPSEPQPQPQEEEKKAAPVNAQQQQPMASAMGQLGQLGLGQSSMQQMQQSLMQNPQLMQQMMNSPMMQQMFSNPELLQNLFSSSPALKQLLKDNPQLRHVLKDPALMKHAMRAASNPEYYNEMLKNNDRALRNIESIPGGFSALSRLYNQIQKPMERAMDDMYRQRFGKSSTKIPDISDKSKGPTVEPMENPWSSDFQRKQQQQQQQQQLGMGMQMPMMANNNNNGAGAGLGSMMDMMRMMNLMNGGAAGNSANANNMPINNLNNVNADPSQIYVLQLQELRNMGFNDQERNINALVLTGGNVAAAVQHLIDNNHDPAKDGKK